MCFEVIEKFEDEVSRTQQNISLLIMISVTGLPFTVQAEEQVYFANPNLKAAVEETLGITNPTPTDMSGLFSLNANNKGISSLEGLEYAINLQVLVIQVNKISDITPLSSLTKLSKLRFSANRISDISPLSSLTNLSELWLGSNRISDISPLSELLKLQLLYIGNNQIKDLSPLSGQISLNYLEITSNQIRDISPLSGLTNLREVWLSYNQISDISELSGLTNLQKLYIQNNPISQIPSLYGLTSLYELHLENNQISNMSSFSELTSLLELHLENNKIDDLSALSGLINLGSLNLKNNQISDLTPLSGLNKLEYVHLKNNQISDLTPLSGLNKLEYVNLDNNQISNIPMSLGLSNLSSLRLRGNQLSDLSPLTTLPSIEGLGLSNNQISNIQPLFELINLRWLLLNKNQISDLSPLSDLINLNQLELSDNQIIDISPLSRLTNLKWLYLSRNQISDISLLTTFTNLIMLTIKDNPLEIDAYNIHIIEMQTRGVGVVYDTIVFTLSSRSTTGGSVITPGEGFYNYNHGTTVTLTAIAQEPNYQFVNWTGTTVDAGRVADPDVSNTTAIIYSDYTLRANFELKENGQQIIQPVIFVDDDAPNDPEANNPDVSDPDEDGSQDNPFDSIQEGIDAASDGNTVIVAPGFYTGDGNRDIDFNGKAITVKSEQGPSTCIIDCQSYYTGLNGTYHRGFYFHNGEDANSVVQGFTITNGLRIRHEPGGGILCDNSSPRIFDCIIVGNEARTGGGISTINSTAQIINCKIRDNTATDGGGIEIGSQNDGVVLIKGSIITGNHAAAHPRFGGLGGGIIVRSFSNIVNCTITDNRAGYSGGGICFLYGASVSNSIIWGNKMYGPFGDDGENLGLRYKCDSQRKLPHVFIEYSLVGSGSENDFDFTPDSNQCLDGQWLEGDPYFVNTGYWDPNGTPNNINDDFWVDGDYHLKSQFGRWALTNSVDSPTNNRNWILDDVTSPCIDAGDPNSPVGHEPLPNGNIINIGAYGGTAEASKS